MKESVTKLLSEGVAGALGAARNAREHHEGATRFARMRMGILGVLGLDVVATIAFVVLSQHSGPFDVEVWLERGFPSDMLVIRNLDRDPIEKVTLVLDDRYRLDTEAVAPGTRGFEVYRDFRDSNDARPEEPYVPTRLEIRADGETMIVPLVRRSGSP